MTEPNNTKDKLKELKLPDATKLALLTEQANTKKFEHAWDAFWAELNTKLSNAENEAKLGTNCITIKWPYVGSCKDEVHDLICAEILSFFNQTPNFYAESSGPFGWLTLYWGREKETWVDRVKSWFSW